jgi:hypothetical protein
VDRVALREATAKHFNYNRRLELWH